MKANFFYGMTKSQVAKFLNMMDRAEQLKHESWIRAGRLAFGILSTFGPVSRRPIVDKLARRGLNVAIENNAVIVRNIDKINNSEYLFLTVFKNEIMKELRG